MATSTSDGSSFPEAAVIAAIKSCWEAETAKGQPVAPTPDKPGSIMDPVVEIDSHGIVRCFVSIEKETGIAIPETEAKDTGYDSLDDLIANLVPLAKKYFEKNEKNDDADRGS